VSLLKSCRKSPWPRLKCGAVGCVVQSSNRLLRQERLRELGSRVDRDFEESIAQVEFRLKKKYEDDWET
jgi:hypothetical protein